MAAKVFVVGMGADGRSGLTPRAREVLDGAGLLIGTSRLLDMVPMGRADRLAANPGREETLRLMESLPEGSRVVVLASGDPGFFGIARVLVRRLGKERVEIVPHLSSVQLAFARIKESWEDATFLSVHGRPLEHLADAVSGCAKVAILTGGAGTPAAVARCLLAAGIEGYRVYLCEDIGADTERVRETDLARLADTEASPLSIVVLLREEGPHAVGTLHATSPRHEDCSPTLGIPDDQFHQKRPHRGLITKLEVRAVALAKLRPRDNGIVWDVGSGSGSVAVEAAALARGGCVYAVERDPENVELMRRNLARFGVQNVVVVPGGAPEVLGDLPDPDSVFVGGSGGRLPDILEVIARRLRAGGRVVVNAATLETAGAAMCGLRERGFQAEVSLVQVSRGKELSGLTRFEALNPVFVVAGWRRDGSAKCEVRSAKRSAD